MVAWRPLLSGPTFSPWPRSLSVGTSRRASARRLGRAVHSLEQHPWPCGQVLNAKSRSGEARFKEAGPPARCGPDCLFCFWSVCVFCLLTDFFGDSTRGACCTLRNTKNSQCSALSGFCTHTCRLTYRVALFQRRSKTVVQAKAHGCTT